MLWLCLKVKVTGQRLHSPEENIAKVVSATSSEGFLVSPLFSYHRKRWPLTFIFEFDLDSVKVKQLVKYLDNRSCNSNVIVHPDTQTHRHIHTSDGLLNLDH